MARAPRGHALAEQAAEHHRRAQVDVQRAVDLLDAEVQERAGGGHARVGHEDVGAGGLVRQALHRVGIGEVDGEHAAAGLRRQRLEHVGAPAGQDERRARAGETARDRVADATRRAGDEGRAAGDVHPGNTATVAVKPCRKLIPPTGPISPAAKKPAAGAPAELAVERGRVVVGRAEQPAPAPVAGEDQRTRRRGPAERLAAQPERLAQVAVGGAGVARVQAHDRPRGDRGADRDRARVGVGADQPAHEEAVVGVLAVDAVALVEHDPEQQAVGDHRALLRVQPLDRLAQGDERRAAVELAHEVAAAVGHGQRRADGRGALRDAGKHLDTAEPQADRAALDHAVVDEQRGAAVGRARAGEAAEDRHAGCPVGQLLEDAARSGSRRGRGR